jgi:hypothetical protein
MVKRSPPFSSSSGKTIHGRSIAEERLHVRVRAEEVLGSAPVYRDINELVVKITHNMDNTLVPFTPTTRTEQ